MARPVPTQATVLASAARTASVDSDTFSNDGYKGVVIIIDTTAASSPSNVVTIQGYSPLGNDYYTIVTAAAVTGTGQTILRVYPGLTAAAGLTVNDVLPPQWRVSIAAGNSNSATYSVAALLIP